MLQPMKVYKIETDDHYQRFVYDGDEERDVSPWGMGGAMLFDGFQKDSSWICPPLRIYDAHKPLGEFFYVGPGCLGCGERALECMRTELELAGQLLPFEADRVRGALLNIDQVVNCLDHEATEWVYGKTTGLPVRCKKYVFAISHLPESTLFKIPAQVKGTVFTHLGHGDLEDSFIFKVREHKLTGLNFRLVFEDHPRA
jgi:hypothetical protein